MINVDKQIQYWVKGADSNLETAEILIANKKFLEGLFFCHLTIEKIIKAHVAKTTKDIPPRSHKLFLLLEKTNITISEVNKSFLGILMQYQLEGRYPEHYPSIPSIEQTYDYLRKTKKLLQWFKKKL